MELELLLSAIKNVAELGTEVVAMPIQKDNLTLTGISIGNGSIRPTFYMEHYEDLFEEKGYDAVAREIMKIYRQMEQPDINVAEITSLDYVKNNVQLCIAPSGVNEKIITIPYLDLELYFRISVLDKNGTYKVSQKMLDRWNITETELLEFALQNTIFTSKSLKLMMAEEMGIPEEMFGNVPDQLVVSSSTKTYGASALYDIELLKSISDKYEDDLYIIPSSIHELIIVAKTDFDKDYMDNMVCEVNTSELDADEVLTNHVYIFNKDTKEITW